MSDLFLDGWDDIDVSDWTGEGVGKKFDYPKGEHHCTITKAEHKTGTSKKTGDPWQALVLTISHPTHGEKRNLYHFPPKQEWWTQQEATTKAAVKAEWAAIGINPTRIDDENARANLIGREVKVVVAGRVPRFMTEGYGLPFRWPSWRQYQMETIG